MNIVPIKTRKIFPLEARVFTLLDHLLTTVPERSILVLTSKIISLLEGRIVPLNENKDELIKREADFYLPREASPYHTALTISHHAFISSAGIDESNAAGHYVLLPKNSQKVANTVRQYLEKRFQRKNIGVLITDSRSVPLRKGAIGVALAWSGFQAIKDYRGTKDLFGRTIQYEVANIADSLAVAAVATMGEGSEQTPIALISDIPFVTFTGKNPTKKEHDFFFIQPEDDLFAPLIRFNQLHRGKKKPIA